MRINYNVSSIIARNALNNNDKRVAASTQKLSSGYKINSAADNAAGLAIARRMNAQIKSLKQANQSANDGLSALNTADGAMTEMHDILQRMNELAIQAANGTNSESDREMMQTEIDQLVNEIDRIADTTQFNAQTLLNGNFAYRAYANVDNAKVMSYTEGVATGTYVIGQLQYSHYKDTTTIYNTDVMKATDTNGNVVNTSYSTAKVKVTEGERFEVNNENDRLSDSLVKSTSSIASDYSDISQFKTFPESAKVTVDKDDIVIKGQGNFEMKISVNDRTPVYGDTKPAPDNKPSTAPGAKPGAVNSVTTTYTNGVSGATVVTTTSFSSVKTYRNIAVTGPDGERYFIDDLKFFNNVDSDGNPIDDPQIYTDFKGDNGKGLKDDFAGFFGEEHPGYGIEIDGVEYVAPGTITPPSTTPSTIGAFKISYTTIDNKTGATVKEVATFELYQAKNDYGNTMAGQKNLENYLYSETQTTRTEYTIGGNSPDNCLKIDVTGMGAMVVQVGANSGQYMELEIPALNAVNLNVDGLDLTTEESATESIDIVGKAINQLSAIRSKIGAYSNRLEHTITNLDSTEENITASYSRIMDVDMATEMTEYSTVQILVQASTSMLAQANERPQQVLQLLQ
ncbi:MAG: hypothetical protein K2P63_03170 [Lachnospiraceae bacterium]|nr:hypothetical protein [Lachnospiraceae bacterium]